MRIKTVAGCMAALVLAASAAPAAAASDVQYYRLNYANYDTTYEAIDIQARHYASFYWDGKQYCRYRTGWNGPGAYEVGTRRRPGFGWDGGYSWQGPGTPADHEDAEDFATAQVAYAQEFRNAPVCEPRRYHRRMHHGFVLRRKD